MGAFAGEGEDFDSDGGFGRETAFADPGDSAAMARIVGCAFCLDLGRVEVVEEGLPTFGVDERMDDRRMGFADGRVSVDLDRSRRWMMDGAGLVVADTDLDRAWVLVWYSVGGWETVWGFVEVCKTERSCVLVSGDGIAAVVIN
jgi:hypothetical protein